MTPSRKTPASPGLRALMSAVLVATAAWTPACGANSEMTIIVISVDTTRPDHLTPYGYDRETTPTLARMAAEGALFTEARSTSSWTLPAHMSLFTGLPPNMHEVVLDQAVLHPSRKTLGEIFSAAGFRTLGFYSAPYLHGQFGFDRSMDYYERCVKPTIWDIPLSQRKASLDRLEAESHRQVSTPEVMQRGLRALKTFGKKRTLLFMHLFDPHYDFMAPRAFAKRFVDPDYGGDINGRDVYTTPIVNGEIEPEDVEQLKALYDAELAFVDHYLQGMLETLSKQGRLDSTLVVITSDHGEAFYEDGRFGHRNDLRDEVLRIPLIVWSPSLIQQPAVIDDPVALTDVLPTLMDYAGIAPEDVIWGRSLRPLIEGRELPPRPITGALHVVPRPEDGGPLGDILIRHESLIHEGFKYVRQVNVPWDQRKPNDVSGTPDPGSVVEYLFDLATDPDEAAGPVTNESERLLHMRALLAAEHGRQAEAAMLHFGGAGALQSKPGLDTIDLIKATGYGGR